MAGELPVSEWRRDPVKYWWELGYWDEPRQEFIGVAWVTDEVIARADPRMTAAYLYRKLGTVPPPLAGYPPPPPVPVTVVYAEGSR
jgi:hypothetical protein